MSYVIGGALLVIGFVAGAALYVWIANKAVRLPW